jgi:gliding motility-associated-like protein
MHGSRSFLLVLLCGAQLAASAQLNAHWFFGANAGVDFSSGSAVPIVGNLDALEGTAAASDANGDLLFYTNGALVWNRLGDVMPFSPGMLGSTTSTQTLIVPQPGNCNRFYIFTTTHYEGDQKCRYSVVDLCLRSGLGNVVQGEKNIVLQTHTNEAVMALPHANGNDLWVIVHALIGDAFHAFLLSDQGISTVPVTSNVGYVLTPSCLSAQLEGAHNGTRLVHVSRCSCDLLDFDPSTGIVSGGRDLNAQFDLPSDLYDAVFSPDDSKLYVTSVSFTTTLTQLDLTTNTATTLGTLPIESRGYCGIQLGPDGKVYVVRWNASYLDVIQYPDLPGSACGHVDQGLPMPRMSRTGLPSAIATDYFRSLAPDPKPDLGPDLTLCPRTPVELSMEPPCHSTVLWSNGEQLPVTVVWAPDTVMVEVQAACGIGRDTLIIHALGTLPDGQDIVPNVFTPNGDGVNDLWRPVAAPDDRVSFTILDRWGKTIFESTETAPYWDGRHANGPVPDGVYYYSCTVDRRAPCASRSERTQGHLTLIR